MSQAQPRSLQPSCAGEVSMPIVRSLPHTTRSPSTPVCETYLTSGCPFHLPLAHFMLVSSASVSPTRHSLIARLLALVSVPSTYTAVHADFGSLRRLTGSGAEATGLRTRQCLLNTSAQCFSTATVSRGLMIFEVCTSTFLSQNDPPLTAFADEIPSASAAGDDGL